MLKKLVLLGLAAFGLSQLAGGSSVNTDKKGCKPDEIDTPTPFDLLELNGAVWGDSSPTLVVFHGMGSNPGAIASYIPKGEKVKVVIPRGFNVYGNNRAWWLVKSVDLDQGKLAAQMKWAADTIAPLLAEIKRCNPGRLVVAGHSQGGMMALAVARFLPDIKTTIAGSGWLPVELQGPMSPTVAIHGSDDTTVPFDRTRDWALAQQASQSSFKWVPVPGGHQLESPLLEAWQAAIVAAIR